MTEPVSTARTGPEWWLEPGLVPYEQAIARMQARVAAIRAGTEDELVWLLQHPPVYTAGTSARAADLHDPDRFAIHRTGRGGQWTYHGPGQAVGYVMLDLARSHGRMAARDVRGFVAGLETWLIATLAALGVAAERRAGRVGLWVVDPRSGAENKIAAIGVRVTRWVSWHGFALNLSPTLEHFSGITPCGIAEHGVTSLAAEGVALEMAALQALLRREFGALSR